jgi:hypothetical protein
VGGRPAGPRVAPKAAPKPVYQMTSHLLPGEVEPRCSGAPRAEREPLEQRARHRWSQSGELQLPDE